jgi:uncharacterized membrane protein (DUF106 family)
VSKAWRFVGHVCWWIVAIATVGAFLIFSAILLFSEHTRQDERAWMRLILLAAVPVGVVLRFAREALSDRETMTLRRELERSELRQRIRALTRDDSRL